MKTIFQDFSLSAHSAQLSAAELSSWVWAISIGSGLLGVILSLRRRAPQVGGARVQTD